MAAEVETMFSVREIPWHGLGQIIPENLSGTQALIAAGLDWEVALEPIYITPTGVLYGDFTPFPGKSAVVRQTDRHPLGVVGVGAALIGLLWILNHYGFFRG